MKKLVLTTGFCRNGPNLNATAWLALLVSMCVATNVGALERMGPAQFLVFSKNACHEVGLMGVKGFKVKEGGGHMAKYASGMVADYFFEDDHRPLIVLAQWSLGFGEMKARNALEAYETSFAKCADNIERVYRNYRNNQLTKENELD